MSLSGTSKRGEMTPHLLMRPVSSTDDFPGPVVVDNLKFPNVAVLLHRLQEFDDDLRARSDQHLALAALLGVRDGLEAVREDAHSNHDCWRAVCRLRCSVGGVYRAFFRA